MPLVLSIYTEAQTVTHASWSSTIEKVVRIVQTQHVRVQKADFLEVNHLQNIEFGEAILEPWLVHVAESSLRPLLHWLCSDYFWNYDYVVPDILESLTTFLSHIVGDHADHAGFAVIVSQRSA